MMKSRLTSMLALLAIGSLSLGLSAQDYDDDDIYFNPSKSTSKKSNVYKNSTYQTVTDYPAADSYLPETGTNIDIDAYNRRGIFAVDSVKTDQQKKEYETFGNTRQIERFYNPEVVTGQTDTELASLYYSQPSATDVNIIINTPDYYWGYPYSSRFSPYYYGSPWYWGTPSSWWYYNNWYYDPWAWNWGYPGLSWSWGWGWNYPSWGWGGYYPPYHRPIWGWNRPVRPNVPSGNVRPGYRPGTVGNGNVRPGYRPGTSGNVRPSYNGNYRPGNSSSGYRPGNSSSGYRNNGGTNRSSGSSRYNGTNRSNSSENYNYNRNNNNYNNNYNSRPSYRPGGSSQGSGNFGGGTRGGGGGGRGRH